MRQVRSSQNEKGQILLPALAVYLGLLVLFFGVVHMGEVRLAHMRLETAAQAAAISATREQAELLNDDAGHNLKLNAFVPASYKGYGATHVSVAEELELWLDEQKLEQAWKLAQGGLLGLPVQVGNTVAELNNGKLLFHWPITLDLYLRKETLTVFYFSPPYPFPVYAEEYDDAYYIRTWKPDERRVQPAHPAATWCLQNGGIQACGTAHLYLDVDQDTAHNGGFPRDSEGILENFEIQSLYPQFNAKLVPTSLKFVALAKVWKGHF